MALMNALLRSELPSSASAAVKALTATRAAPSSQSLPFSGTARDYPHPQVSQSQGFATRAGGEERSDNLTMRSPSHQEHLSQRANEGSSVSPWSSGGHLLMRSSQWLRRVLSSTDPERANEAPFAAITGTRGCAGTSYPAVPHHAIEVNYNHHQQQHQQTDSPCLASGQGCGGAPEQGLGENPSSESPL